MSFTDLLPGPIKRRLALSRTYRNVFGSLDGKFVLVDLIKRAGLLEAEPGKFAAGRRSIVLEIMTELRFDEKRLLEMSQEQVDDGAGQE